ncbi:MAG: SpoIIE family protein phosphatase [Spirochaetaceae bacterium]|nr:SpoIIE family protein phosphatase [Spirochaetaceae bacterium]
MKTIRTKVLRSILALSLGVIVALSVTMFIALMRMQNTVLSDSTNIGQSAANDSQNALLSQVKEELTMLANDRADITDERLKAIMEQTEAVATLASEIYTHPENYKERFIDYLHPDELGTAALSLRTAPWANLNTIRSEVYLLANVGDTLKQVALKEGSGIDATFIGTESGFMIMYNNNETMANANDYDHTQRVWYGPARDAGRLVWSDIFTTAEGRGAAITCPMPFYDYSGPTPVFKGVASTSATLDAAVQALIDSSNIGTTGYAFIMDSKGKVLLSSNQDIINTYLFDRIDKEAGFIETTLNDEPVYVAYSPLQNIDWIFGIVAKTEEIAEPAAQIQNTILALTESSVDKIASTIMYVVIAIIVVILIAVVATFVIGGYLSRSISEPVIKLSEDAQIISAGNLEHKLDVKTGDEIEELGNSFNQMIDSIQTITAEKQRVASELSIASEIQNDMLPRIFPVYTGSENFNIYAKMIPAKEVGGDFYDFFFLDEAKTKLVMVIADVSGKGVPAALFMVIAKTLIKQQMQHVGDPAEALKSVNRVLCEDNPRNMFVTTFIICLDLESGFTLFANGGHNAPLISIDGQNYEFMKLKKGIPPGMFDTAKYQLSTIQLHEGDRIYFYTDGINEAMNIDGEEWGNERFIAEANRYINDEPEEFDNHIREALGKWTEGAEQSDDITSIAFHFIKKVRR